MKQYTDLSTGEIKVVDGFLSAVVDADNATDLCRHLVHSPTTANDTIGAQLLWLNLGAELTPVAQYGVVPGDVGYSLWADEAPCKALRAKQVVVDHDSLLPELWVTALPLMRDELPIGCLLLSSLSGIAIQSENPEIFRVLGRIGAYYLHVSGIASGGGLIESPESAPGAGNLTSRQRTILAHIADGKTNAEIAQELLLSESSIRQETVRIYRALGVKNRALAAKKGKALGIISNAVDPELLADPSPELLQQR